MPVKIRLMRIGAKKRPFYRVIAIDERKKRNGSYLELLGTYNPLTEPKEIILKKDRIEHWLKQGAILSDGYLRITKQAPQKPPRKPKKEKKVTGSSEQPKEKPVKDTETEPTAEIAEKTDSTEQEKPDQNQPVDENITQSEEADKAELKEEKVE